MLNLNIKSSIVVKNLSEKLNQLEPILLKNQNLR